MKIPLCKIYIDDKEVQAVKKVLDSGWLAHGPKNKEFEKEFSSFIGTKYASCFNSCASALQTAIMVHNLKGEIIVPSFSFTASANVVLLAGCTPVFADINPVTFNIDTNDIERKITNKTVAIMPVHYAGQICEMDKIIDLAKNHNLIVIEDSAETIGAELNGKKAGSFGVGCFSFYPTKNITTGEGGMITYNDEKLSQTINALKGHGIVKSVFERDEESKPWLRDAVMPGYNFRMSDINAAIGLEQMKKLPTMNALRQKNAVYLNKKLKEAVMENIVVPEVDDIKTHVYQMYVIKIIDASKRDGLLNYLNKNLIGASVHFEPPIHLQTYYKKNYPTSLPVTEKISKQLITLPMFPSLTKEEMDFMVEKIKYFFEDDN